MVCNKCNKAISGNVDLVKCIDCKSEFHVGCCRTRAAKIKAGAPWRCDDCTKDVSSVNSGKSDAEESGTIMDVLKAIQKQMSSDSKEFRASFSGLENSLKSVQETLVVVTSRLAVVEAENVTLKNECEAVKDDNIVLKGRLDDAEWRLFEMEQYSRMSNVEIKGVPATRGENVYAVLESVAKALGVSYAACDVSIAHRLPAPRDRRYQPTIVVQFVCRATRAVWLDAARKKRIQTNDIHASFPPGPVYINEHLTRHNKELLRRGKSLVKSGVLMYAWCRDGKVLVRRTENSGVQRILRSFNELEVQPRSITLRPDDLDAGAEK